MNDRLIISMTSFPPRINGVSKVWYSIFRQNVDRSLYKAVLVLAEPEFPKKEESLPEDLRIVVEAFNIEIIWTQYNIKSHKKLIPTLLKYPNDDILVIDDDVIREEGWLACFIEDHKKHPNDIIAGTILYHLKNDEFIRYPNFLVGCTDFGEIIKNGRPANGAGGTLYPKNTFTDKRFFDEELFMNLSPTSDESWQFYFNYRENKTIRLLSKFFSTRNYIPGSQNQPTALYKINKKQYNDIWKKLKTNVSF